MEFRLTYEGSLPAAGRSTTRNSDKARIRKMLGTQLRELWATHPRLRPRYEPSQAWDHPTIPNPDPSRRGWSWAEKHSRKYNRCGRNFLPLIAEDSGVACGLDILFLRRDQPGNLIQSGGDIDNRVKVLFDALRMPQNCDEVEGPPEQDDDPFFVLLEDDRLITEVKVSTDRMLSPMGSDDRISDVQLVIHVRTILIATVFSSHMFLA